MTNYNYHQLLKYVYFEGYANSYEEAESLLEQLTDEEFSQLYSLYESSGMSQENKRTWKRLVAQHGEQPFTNPTKSKTRSASKREEPTPQSSQSGSSEVARKNRKKIEYREDYEMILSYLLDEGYADNEKSALAIMNSMSEEWMMSIVEGPGFPNVRSTNVPGEAGTMGLKLIRTPSGQTGHINKYSGGNILPSGTVNKIMSGDLMVKKQDKSNTKTA